MRVRKYRRHENDKENKVSDPPGFQKVDAYEPTAEPSRRFAHAAGDGPVVYNGKVHDGAGS